MKGAGRTIISPDSVVRRQREPLFTRLDDEFFALDPQAGLCYGLNVSAARVWELLEAPTTPRDVCRRLVEEYEVDHTTCATDVIAVMEDLRAAGLVAVTKEGE